MKYTLIFLGSLAVILGIFAYFAVFGNSSGTYAVNPIPTSSPIATSTQFILPSSTQSSTVSSDGTNGSSSAPGTDFYGSAFTSPPLTWNDGGASFSVTSIALQGNEMTFTMTVQMGATPACVPLDLRLVADESGDLQGPDTPSFSFPDSGNCNGASGYAYANQNVAFTVDPANLPLLFTTGGPSNIFFEVATTTSNGLEIQFPSTSG